MYSQAMEGYRAAFCATTSLKSSGSETETFVYDYYSVEKFKAAYAEN
jgi:hypothetical protein